MLFRSSPEFAQYLGINGVIKGGEAIMYTYAGITAGDFLCGLLSQLLKSRKRAVLIFLLITGIGTTMFFTATGNTADYLYLTMFVMGVGTGFWAVIVTNAAEQFGTNIRGTVATTVPNFIRGSLPIISLFYALLQFQFSKILSAEILAAIILSISLWALYHTEETYGKDLDFIETQVA